MNNEYVISLSFNPDLILYSASTVILAECLMTF